MIKVLHIYPQLNNAGTEMVIMNLYRNIDRTKVQFDFLVQRAGELDDTVKQIGAQIHTIQLTKSYQKDVYDFLTKHSEYRIIHTHTHGEMSMVLRAAKKAGVPYIIAHSHNYRGDVPKLLRFLKRFKDGDIEKQSTHLLACSEEAAQWLFPTKYKSAVVWNNAIDLDKFAFSADIRVEYRKLLGIPENAKVCCHVGRFAEQKNHKRIIEIFNALADKHQDFYGIFVGVGPLFDQIKACSKSDRIMFLGNRTDVSSIMCAADVFLFPSLYEGLGIVAVEAQSSGLKCIASSNVPKAADIGIGMFSQHDLKDSNEVWLTDVCRQLESVDLDERYKKSKSAIESDYNIGKVAKKAQEFYLGLK